MFKSWFLVMPGFCRFPSLGYECCCCGNRLPFVSLLNWACCESRFGLFGIDCISSFYRLALLLCAMVSSLLLEGTRSEEMTDWAFLVLLASCMPFLLIWFCISCFLLSLDWFLTMVNSCSPWPWFCFMPTPAGGFLMLPTFPLIVIFLLMSFASLL